MSIRRLILSFGFGVAMVLAYAGTAHAACTMSAPTCTLPGPQVHLNWSGSCGGNSMERGANPFGGGWDALTHRTDFFPSQCATFWCGPRGMGGATSYTDNDVVINDATPYTYSYRIKITPGWPSNQVNFSVSTCTCGGACPPSNNAQFIAISAPSNATPGQTFLVQITMKNTGSTTWTAGAGYALTTSPANAALWQSVSSVTVTGSVAANATTTFSFLAKAPAISGSYSLGPWQMSKSGVAFGQASPATPVTVNQAVQGTLEAASCAGLTGWAKDPDTGTPLNVRIYRDGPNPGVGVLVTTITANQAHAAPYNGYGFFWTPPTDATNHRYWLYAHDLGNGVWYQLGGTPSAQFACYPPPTATITTMGQPDYCQTGPAATANWLYSDPAGLPQGQYQVHIATDATFTALVFDSGIKNGATTSAGTGSGVLTFAKTYWVRVKVWDSMGTASVWSPASSFTTPTGPYPQAAFTMSPTSPIAQQPATFTDTSAYNGGVPTVREWDFGDGSPISGASPEMHTYAATATGITVTLRVASNVMPPNQFCATTKSINVQKPLPSIKEVRPGAVQP